MTWLMDLVRHSIREYEPFKPEQDNSLYLNNSFLDLRYNSSRWFVLEKNFQKETVPFSENNDYRKYMRTSLKYLKTEIARVNGVSVSEVIIGNNVPDLLRNLLFCLIEDDDEVVLSSPAPSLYKDLIRLYGGSFTPVPSDSDLMPREDLLLSACNSQTKVMILQNPLFLSGIQVPEREILSLLSRMDKYRTLLLVDETENILDLPDTDSLGTELFKNYGKIALIRSFHELYSTSGLSMAYSILPAPLSREYNKIGNISLPSAYALQQALNQWTEKARITKIKKNISLEKTKMQYRLKEMGLQVIKNCTPNIVIHLVQADKVWECIAKEGILVTNGEKHSIPGYLIISVGLPEENEKFLSVLRKVLNYLGHS